MHSEDNRNLLLAIALSITVMVGWNYYFGVPKLTEQRQASQTVPGPTLPSTASDPAASAAPSASSVVQPRETALAASPRVHIETPVLSGSIRLVGARIDDVHLKGYHETVDPKSPTITLFSPQGSANAYYADFGWLAASGVVVALPGPQTLWQADGQKLDTQTPLTLTWDNGQGLVFTRKITLDSRYMFTLADSVRNNGAAPVTLSPYGRLSRHGTPKTEGFYVLHEGPLGYLEDKLQEPSYEDLRKGKVKPFAKSTGGWLGITDKYWASALIPDQKKSFSAAMVANNPANNPANLDSVYEVAAIGEVQTLAPGEQLETSARLFAGAKEVRTIDAYAQGLGISKFDLMIDWGWFYFLTKPMFYLMDFVKGLVGNFGITILIVTVLIKGLFFPLANKSYVSMAKMKEVQPEMVAIKERFPDDKMKQQQAMMELYRKEKINPMAGCWPVLIQIPVFFALYKVLFVTIEMRHAPFFGWIKDLAAQDPTNMFNLFGLLPFTPPAFLHLGVWPIIMGITMWLQMKMNPEPTDPVQKAMFAWMPLVFTFMLGSFPAGLVIYWAWNNILSVLQQYAIMRRLGVKVELWDNLRTTLRRQASSRRKG